MRAIKEIIVHCTATQPNIDVGVREITQWHVKDHGWSGCGYHYVIRKNGFIEKGREVWRQGAHCVGHNRHSIGVCYVGGLDGFMRPCDTRTDAQKRALRKLLSELVEKYHCEIHGHREYSSKACPCFDAYSEYKDLWQK